MRWSFVHVLFPQTKMILAIAKKTIGSGSANSVQRETRSQTENDHFVENVNWPIRVLLKQATHLKNQQKIADWPAKNPQWPANLIIYRSRWPLYFQELFRGLLQCWLFSISLFWIPLVYILFVSIQLLSINYGSKNLFYISSLGIWEFWRYYQTYDG